MNNVNQIQIDDIITWKDEDNEWWCKCPHREKGLCEECDSIENKSRAMLGKAKLQATLQEFRK